MRKIDIVSAVVSLTHKFLFILYRAMFIFQFYLGCLVPQTFLSKHNYAHRNILEIMFCYICSVKHWCWYHVLRKVYSHVLLALSEVGPQLTLRDYYEEFYLLWYKCRADCFILVSCLVFSSTLKKKATCFPKTFIEFRQNIRFYIPADKTLHIRWREDLRSCTRDYTDFFLKCPSFIFLKHV